MACGLPVATSVYNGCHPELVHSENGWTFDPLSKQSIVDVLDRIVSSKDKLLYMGRESLKIVSSETPERAAKSIMEAINFAIKRVRKK